MDKNTLVDRVDENEYLEKQVTTVYAVENPEIILRERLEMNHEKFIYQVIDYYSTILNNKFDIEQMIKETDIIKYLNDIIKYDSLGKFLEQESDEVIQNKLNKSYNTYIENNTKEFIDYMINNHKNVTIHVCLINPEFTSALFNSIKKKEIYKDLVEVSVYMSIGISDETAISLLDKDFLYFISDIAGDTIAKPAEHPISKDLPSFTFHYLYVEKINVLIDKYEDDDRAIENGIKNINQYTDK